MIENHLTDRHLTYTVFRRLVSVHVKCVSVKRASVKCFSAEMATKKTDLPATLGRSAERVVVVVVVVVSKDISKLIFFHFFIRSVSLQRFYQRFILKNRSFFFERNVSNYSTFSGKKVFFFVKLNFLSFYDPKYGGNSLKTLFQLIKNIFYFIFFFGVAQFSKFCFAKKIV